MGFDKVVVQSGSANGVVVPNIRIKTDLGLMNNKRISEFTDILKSIYNPSLFKNDQDYGIIMNHISKNGGEISYNITQSPDAAMLRYDPSKTKMIDNKMVYVFDVNFNAIYSPVKDGYVMNKNTTIEGVIHDIDHLRSDSKHYPLIKAVKLYGIVSPADLRQDSSFYNTAAHMLAMKAAFPILDSNGFSTGIYADYGSQQYPINENEALIRLTDVNTSINYTMEYFPFVVNAKNQVLMQWILGKDYSQKGAPQFSSPFLPTWEVASLPYFDLDAVKDGSALGSIVGATIGGLIGGKNSVSQFVNRAVFAVIGGRLGAGIGNAISAGDISAFIEGFTNDSLGTISKQLGDSFKSAAVGTVSSMLAVELADAVGLDGVAGQVFGQTVGSVLQHVTNNVIKQLDPLTGLDGVKAIFDLNEAGALATTAIATFLGNRLGSLVVSPQTTAGVVLANLGSAASAYAFSAAGFGWGSSLLSGVFGNGFIATNFVFPGVGAFVGFVLGALIGNLFGRKKPKVPTANAETVLNYNQGLYQLGAVTVTNNGNRALVESMALSARDILNGMIQTIVGDLNPAWIVSSASPTQTYGHTGVQIWAKYNGVTKNFSDLKGDAAASAVEWATLKASRDTLIAGGDMIAKRALYYSPSDTLTSLLGDLQIAGDYSRYLRNREQINTLILAPWNNLSSAAKNFFTANQAVMTRILAKDEVALSATDQNFYNSNKGMADTIIAALKATQFDAGWLVTLERAAELNLNEWRPSDFYGGLRGLFDSFNLLELGIGYEQVGMAQIGSEFTFSLPNTVMSGVFAGVPTASADGRSFTISNFGSAIGFNMIGGNPAAVTKGNDYANGYGLSSVVFDDLRNGQSGGDDIFLGTNGADTLRGQAGHDWLQGYDGTDLLEGGDGNDVLIGGQHKDRLYGGNGDDYLFGGEGWDHPQSAGDDAGLHGGAGNDILVQNKSGNTSPTAAWGDEGDDLFIMIEDNNDYDHAEGGNGSDTISFERFTTVNAMPFNGVTVTLAPTVFGDAILSMENVTGSQLNDFITGDAGSNVLRGLTGDDRLDGLDGNDTLEGGVGADTLNGSVGVDTVSYEKSSTAVYVDFMAGTATSGDAAGDVWNSVENLRGSYYDDVLGGDNYVNRIEGLRGNDVLVASAGADTLDGGEGLDTADYRNFNTGATVNLATSTSTLISIEHLSGSRYADSLTGNAGDNILTGAGGNDTLNGGAGSDTYVFSLGDGSDTINDDNSNSNTLLFQNLTWSDLAIGTPNRELILGVRGTSEQMRVLSNFATTGNGIIKSIDVGGGSILDIGHITYAWGGTDRDEGAENPGVGQTNQSDLMFGYNGNDIIFGASRGKVENASNVIVGGFGNDNITTSNGDDWFGFDRGDGQDTIADSGGEDTLVFGPNTAPDDIIFEISDGHLWIGIKDRENESLKASQVSDRIYIAHGGSATLDVNSKRTWNTIDFVQAGGTTIDIRNLDLPWKIIPYSGSGPLNPIVFDLAGDGANLSTVAASHVVARTDSGALFRVGWVGPTDGILALDRNGDGQINQTSEISFIDDLEGATSDLEGLAAYDSNHDNVFDAQDARFGEFRIWIDKNQNGRSTGGELQTLTEVGIVSINLKGQKTGMTGNSALESVVVGTTGFKYSNGNEGTAYDVALARRFIDNIGNELVEIPEDIKGAGDENATFGYLKSESIQPNLIQVNDTSLTVLDSDTFTISRDGGDQGLNYDVSTQLAQLDFSDHDVLAPHDAAMWADQLSGKEILTLADGINDPEAEKRWQQIMSVSADGSRKVGGSRAAVPLATTTAEAALDTEQLADRVTASQDDTAARLVFTQDIGGDSPQSQAISGMVGGEEAASIDTSSAPLYLGHEVERPWYLMEDYQSASVGPVNILVSAEGLAVERMIEDNSTGLAIPSLESQRFAQALAAFNGGSGAAPVRATDPTAFRISELANMPLIDRLPTVKPIAA